MKQLMSTNPSSMWNEHWESKPIARHIIKTVQFFNDNYLYILWFTINFFVARMLISNTILVTVIYVASVAIALSPIGEEILRVIDNCREVATKEEKNYLLPLFEEVYEYAKEIDPMLSSEIKLFLMDGMHIDTFAVGRKTIAITRGAVATLTKDEIKGLLAHELGHMSLGHTKARLLVRIGNLFFSLIVRGSKLMSKIAEQLYNLMAKKNFWGYAILALIYITRYITDALVFLFVTSGEIIVAYNSRENDTQADKFAQEMGYGKELISALYLLQKITIHSKITVMERAKAMRPFIAYRIRDLETLEDEDNTEEE